MKLACVLTRTDFVPMIKTSDGRLWMAKETVHEGDVVEVDSDIGHNLMVTYPKCFKVVEYDGDPKRARTPRKKVVEGSDTKQIEADSLEHGDTAEMEVV